MLRTRRGSSVVTSLPGYIHFFLLDHLYVVAGECAVPCADHASPMKHVSTATAMSMPLGPLTTNRYHYPFS